jgi:HSP20 family protein
VEDLFERMYRLMRRMDETLPVSSLPALTGERALRAPLMDVSDEGNHLRVHAELPGMSKEGIQVKVEGNSLTISGEEKGSKEEKKKDYYYRERRSNSFYRHIALPCEVKTEGVKASYKNGVLEIILPKAQEAKKAKSVKIE